MKYSEKINREEFSVAIPQLLNTSLCKNLLRGDGNEDVAFALYKPSLGSQRFTGLIYKIILPQEGERVVHGNVDIKPEYFKRACQEAVAEKSGLVLLHSHLGPGWQGMSLDDINTERRYSINALTLTDLPLIGMTLGTDNYWSARLWEENNGWMERKMASSVRVTGKKLDVFFNDSLRPEPEFKNIYRRTITVWGKKNHSNLARLRIGVIGLGSVGSMVAEMLARMGVERFVLIDFDEVQEHNLDRLSGATKEDIGQEKAFVAARQIRKSGTATNIQTDVVLAGVTEKEGYYKALDCDVIFSCVDRPWPRHILNHLAYNHLIPVVDGGIKVSFDPTTQIFMGADWQLQTVGFDRPCLSCIGAYKACDVATEMAGLLDDPTYLQGLPLDHGFKNNENVFPFSASLASLEIMQFIEMVTGIGGADNFGIQRFVYNHGHIRHLNSECEDGCIFKECIGLGDSQFDPPYGFDHSASIARKRQNNIK